MNTLNLSTALLEASDKNNSLALGLNVLIWLPNKSLSPRDLCSYQKTSLLDLVMKYTIFAGQDFKFWIS